MVNISSNLDPHVIIHAYIQALLESNITRNFFYWNTQAFKDKYITLEFQKPVWLNQIQLVVHTHVSWTLHFIWQYSDDGKTWKNIGNEYSKEFQSSIQPPVSSPIEMYTFLQEAKHERHTHWRMYGLDGQITNDPYINALFIDLTL